MWGHSRNGNSWPRLNRYMLSQRDKFATNPDGSVDMYLEADSPDEANEANWLPAPRVKFGLMLRLYWPRETRPSILSGTWTPPQIKLSRSGVT